MFDLIDQALLHYIPSRKKDHHAFDQSSCPPVAHLINRDILSIIFKHFASYTDLRAYALVSMQWSEVVRASDLKLKEINALMSILGKPQFLDNQPIIHEKIIYQKKTFFTEESFNIKGKNYKKTDSVSSSWWHNKESKIFFVDLSLKLKKIQKQTFSSEEEQQVLFKLERQSILLSTKGKIQSDFAILPIKWTVQPSQRPLNEEEMNLVNKIKLEIENSKFS